jgi:hypothetical protein
MTVGTAMRNGKRWVLAFGIAAAAVIGGAGGVTATTAEHGDDGKVQLDYKVVHEEDDEGVGDEKSKSGKKDDDRNADDKGKSGDSSDKADDDASDANDTDGPGDDEDD